MLCERGQSEERSIHFPISPLFVMLFTPFFFEQENKQSNRTNQPTNKQTNTYKQINHHTPFPLSPQGLRRFFKGCYFRTDPTRKTPRQGSNTSTAEQHASGATVMF